MRRGLTLAAAMAAALVLATGCGSGDGGSDDSSGEVLGTVDTMYGTVEVPQPDDGDLTVVALGYSDAEMALALGIKPVGVYDWQGFGEENKGVGPWATEQFGDVTPTVIVNSGAGPELRADPGPQPRPDPQHPRGQRRDGVQPARRRSPRPSTRPTGTEDFATAWDVQMKSIAAAVGQTEEGEQIISDVTGQIAAAKEANPEFAGLTVASGTKFGNAYGAYLAGDNRFDILADLGFVQNPPILELPTAGFYATVSQENISALDADVSVFLPFGFTLAETQSDPLISSLAVGPGRPGSLRRSRLRARRGVGCGQCAEHPRGAGADGAAVAGGSRQGRLVRRESPGWTSDLRALASA